MKKRITILSALVMALALAACTGNADPTQPPRESQQPFSFTYKGTQIRLHDDVAPIVAALGDPISYNEAASCAFTGKDKTYHYGSFCLTTYPVGDKDYVFHFWFTDGSVTTAEGLYIGAPQAMAEELCGAESFNGLNAYIQNLGDTRMTVIIADGAVSSIQYTVVLS